MAGPWESYQLEPSGPWGQFATPRAPVQLEVTKEPPPSAEAPGPWQMFQKAIEPITSYPATQRRMANEGLTQAGQGISDLRPQSMGGAEGGTAGALWDVAAGSLKYATSPIEAGLETVVGKPIEENFGVPKELPMLAAGLAIPYYGLAGGKLQTGAKKIFTPEAVGPEAEQAAGAVRAAQGVAARDTATTAQALEAHYPAINALDDPGRLDLIRYMENRAAGATVAPELQGVADVMRTAFEARKAKIQALPAHQQAQFIDDYFPHFWQDPNTAANFAATHTGGVGKQGSGASLKARSVPTIDDGIQAGLVPLTTNPIEATMRYVNSMDKFIAQQQVLGNAVRDGTVRYVQPKTMGASGHPDSFKVPSGFVPLEGRGATNATGGRAYAPENWARIYNNFHSQGVERFGSEYGSAYTAARQASNAVTALELSISGYHALTMSQEAVVNQLARAIQQGGRGNMMESLASALKAPFAPFTLARRGGKVERGALGVGPMTPEMSNIVDILTEAGARFKGREHAHDLGSSALGSYFKAWQRGSLKTEVAADAALAGTGVKSAAAVTARNVGRAMDTVMQPIFEVYIPKLKNGAAYENMADWLKAHPAATREQSVAAARKIVDSVDNRFGEMIQDNLFWNRFMKQSAMLSMRSYSWTMGSIREIGGGVTDTLAGAGRNEMTQRQAYIIALPIVYAMQGAMYQMLKTGQPPQDMQDLKAPRTGGVDAATGEPERIVPPGYMKDVFGWTSHPRQEFTNKIATAPRLAWQATFTGRDWRNDPIAPPQEDDTSIPANVPSWLKAYFTHTIEALGPISVKNAARGPKIGSNLNAFERVLGLQPAGMAKTSPEGFEVMMRRKEFKEWRLKQMHDEMEKDKYREYKGP